MKMWKKMKKDAEAISPVVATLLLVLVAVASVTAFYVWQSSWQKGITEQVGDTGVQSSLTIGGSTTVYDFMTVAADLYMKNNTNYKVTVQGGGSGAGIAAAASGAVDIGMSSNSLTDAQKTQYPKLVETVVGKDGVCVVVPTANTHLLTSMNSTVLYAIYAVNGGLTTFTAPTWLPHAGAKYIWSEVPKTAAQNNGITSFCNGAQTVKIYDRSDVSGTEEQFVKMLTGSKKQLEDVGITASHALGNNALVAAVAADGDGIGFTPFGFITSSAGVAQLTGGFQSNGKLVPEVASVTNIKDLSYGGARVLEVLTNGAPTGSVKAFITFITSPQVNTQVCTSTGFVSIYA